MGFERWRSAALRGMVAGGLLLATFGGMALTASSTPSLDTLITASEEGAAASTVSDGTPADEAEIGGNASDAAASIAQLQSTTYTASSKKELEKMRCDALAEVVAEEMGETVTATSGCPAAISALSSLTELAWPIANYSLTDVFGSRGGNHMGIDLAAGAGEPIGAAAPGVVVLSSDAHFGYGVAVIVQHVGGLQTVYGHMQYGSRTVEVGDWVETGDHLGGVGNTGRSFGNHLHFEVRKNGVPIDPSPLLTGGSAAPEDLLPGVPVPDEPPAPEETPKPAPDQTPAPDPSETPDPSPSPDPTETPDPTPTPDPSETPTPSPTPDPEPTETPDPTPSPDPSETPDPEPEPDPTPDPEPSESPDPEPDPEPTEDPAPTQEPEPTQAPDPSEAPADPSPSPDGTPAPE